MVLNYSWGSCRIIIFRSIGCPLRNYSHYVLCFRLNVTSSFLSYSVAAYGILFRFSVVLAVDRRDLRALLVTNPRIQPSPDTLLLSQMYLVISELFYGNMILPS